MEEITTSGTASDVTRLLTDVDYLFNWLLNIFDRIWSLLSTHPLLMFVLAILILAIAVAVLLRIKHIKS